MGGRLRHHFEEKIAAMPLPAFDELPFNARPDLTPYLLHLTKNTEPEDDLSAYDNLVSILKTGEIRGSSSRKGFIKGPNKAACFMDVPFVPIKSAEQQSVLMLHRARDLLVRQQTMTVNAIRAHLAEFGIIAAQGIQNMAKVIAIITDVTDQRIPDLAREALMSLAAHYEQLKQRILEFEKKIVQWHRSNEMSQRLATIPGVGPITASALVATIADPSHFTSARQFAAWVGLVPRQHSTGGKERLGSVSKRGNPYLRRLLVIGAQSVLRWGLARLAKASPWLRGLLARRPLNVVATALANKMARIVWAMMTRKENYKTPVVVAAA